MSGQKIWDNASHNAFTDLIRFRDRWYCAFREGVDHARDNGVVRVIESDDGVQWRSAALLQETGIDLRDPKFSITPDGRLMLVIGGSVLEENRYVDRQSRVAFSRDGRAWGPLHRVLPARHWLWRVTWFKGEAYGVSYVGGGGLRDHRQAFLFKSADGLDWKKVVDWDLPGANETTVRFLPDGEMIALVRSAATDPIRSYIGSSRPPYQQWTWAQTPYGLGGPNFILLPDGRWVAGTRAGTVRDQRKTALAWMNRERLEFFLEFVSGGDNSYPGLVWHRDELWVSYYSSHEGKSAIYLARIRLPATEGAAAVKP